MVKNAGALRVFKSVVHALLAVNSLLFSPSAPHGPFLLLLPPSFFYLHKAALLIQCALGILGNWFDKDYDVHGPAGPTAFWKVSDDIVEEKKQPNTFWGFLSSQAAVNVDGVGNTGEGDGDDDGEGAGGNGGGGEGNGNGIPAGLAELLGQ